MNRRGFFGALTAMFGGMFLPKKSSGLLTYKGVTFQAWKPWRRISRNEMIDGDGNSVLVVTYHASIAEED